MMGWAEDKDSFDVGQIERFICISCGGAGVGVAGVGCDDDPSIGDG